MKSPDPLALHPDAEDPTLVSDDPRGPLTPPASVALPRPDPPAANDHPPLPSWRQRAFDALDAASAWLPIILMALVALGTWWLVNHTPLFEPGRAAAPPRHEPDYTMNRFMVQRFARDGALRVEIQGERMRHYPDTDTYEIDMARLRSIGADGRVTHASAQRALANRDASEVQLSGGAHVVREAGAGEQAIDFRGEFLDVFQATEQLRSNHPVVVTQGENEIHADGMDYDHLTRRLGLQGHVRAVLAAASAAGRR